MSELHPNKARLFTALAALTANNAMVTFSNYPMAADWDLREVVPAESRAQARDKREAYLRKHPHHAVELWAKQGVVWVRGECNDLLRMPSYGENVLPARVPLETYVSDGLRIWRMRSLKNAGVPSAWDDLPCMVCYASLSLIPHREGTVAIKDGDIMVGLGPATMIFVGPKKRADAVIFASTGLRKDVQDDIRTRGTAEGREDAVAKVRSVIASKPKKQTRNH